MSMAVLEVGIGLTFMYVLLSLLVTTVQEWIASLLHMRATNLYDALDNLLADPELANVPEYRNLLVDFYKHPVIKSLYKRSAASAVATTVAEFRAETKRRLPSYIPSRSFATALLDVLRGKTKALNECGVDQLLLESKQIIEKLPAGELRTTLGLLLGDAGQAAGNVNARADLLGKRIESWFNDAMGRASGWYKRRAQLLSFVIGLVAAAGLNADTLHVAERLWNDNVLRASVTASAQAYTATHAPAGGGQEDADGRKLAQQYGEQLAALDASSLPIGWSEHAPESLVLALGGWLLTALAASLGATFWFDLLGKSLQIRGSGAPVSAVTGATGDRDPRTRSR